MPSTKKQRTAISCSVRRKRKSKCDRQRTFCGLCHKRSVVHLCSYEDQQQVTREELLPTETGLSTPDGENMPAFTQKRHILMAMGNTFGHDHGDEPRNGWEFAISPSSAHNLYLSMVPASLHEVTWFSEKSHLDCFGSPLQDL